MRERWSHSKLKKLTGCGEAYRREFEERDFQPPTTSMIRGTAVHAVAADAHLRQMRARSAEPEAPKGLVLRASLPGVEEAADLAATRFDVEVRAGGVAPEPGIPAGVDLGRNKDMAVRMSTHYVERVAPFLDPIAVERKVVVEPADSDVAVVGVQDLVTRDDHGVTLRDLKTGERKPPSNAAHESSQLSMYALLHKLETGVLPDKVALDHLISERGKLGGVYRVSLESTRTQEDVDAMVARLNNAIEAARKGVFVANGPGSWLCSPKWCRFWSTCRFVSKSGR